MRLTGQMGIGLTGGGLRYPGVYAALDFAGNHYELASRSYGNLANVPGWSFTRASTAWGFGSDGFLRSFSSGTVRLVYDPVTLASLGILVEEARTNVCLWNRDLTNVVWTASNITPLKDQTGIDGVANSASKITATAGNGTILQAITLGSSVRQQSAFVKRITGSGVIEMTTDNGTTWTAVTVTASWTRVTIPVQTLANPTVGFRIVTSGDAVAIDCVGNEGGTGASSAIPTTSAAVTRAADAAYLTGLSLSYPLTVAVEFYRLVDKGTDEFLVQIDAGASTDRVVLEVNSVDRLEANMNSGGAGQGNSAPTVSVPLGSLSKGAARYGTDTILACLGGVLGTEDTTATAPATPSNLRIGSNQSAQGQPMYPISRIRVWNTAKTAAQLQALTA